MFSTFWCILKPWILDTSASAICLRTKSWHRLNTVGDKGEPWVTPLLIVIAVEHFLFTSSFVLLLVINVYTMWRSLDGISSDYNVRSIRACPILSNAFAKSNITKLQLFLLDLAASSAPLTIDALMWVPDKPDTNPLWWRLNIMPKTLVDALLYYTPNCTKYSDWTPAIYALRASFAFVQ